MKRNLALVLILVLVLSTLAFTGCSPKEEVAAPAEKEVEKTEESKEEPKEEVKEEPKEEQEIVIYQNKVEIHEQLTEFAAKYTDETGVKVTVKTSGGDSPYAENLKAEFQSDRQPDVFVIEGMGGYNTWKSKLETFKGQEWMDLTELEFVVEGQTFGFPVAVEAWGMAYNAEILEKAGVDPASLTSQEAYKVAFEKIDSMKDELGLDSVVAMAAGPDMRWVTGLHNFNGYLSAGLEYGDTTVLDKLNNGEADMDRLTEYADWVELLFNYADKAVLLTGNYDSQVGQFGVEKSAFIHQGNWIDPWLMSNGVEFEMGFAPHASVYGEHNAIFIGAPSYYVLNNQSENKEAVQDFLNYLASNEMGHDYMVNQAKMVPAFSNVTLKPDAPLSSNVAEWLKVKNGAYTWLQNDMPDGFGMGTIAPLYEAFAKGDIDKAEFIKLVAAKIEEIK
ncbi:MAG: ABC transporter substrate-binding protein [Bacillota bacterium]|nr:ABC transporter substrate-binding protein [Bacillota bacterium]